MKRKGQAAIEYLITYGWTILLIIITIGIIIYFDVLNPLRFLPLQCEFGEQVKCVDMQLNNNPDPTIQNSIIRLKFLNNFPKAINLTDAESLEYTTVTCNEIGIEPSYTNDFVCIIDGKRFPEGDKVQMRLKILFNRAASGAPVHEIRGMIVTTVESGP
jgi:hypothetical protein